jgi:hypothetical protein
MLNPMVVAALLVPLFEVSGPGGRKVAQQVPNHSSFIYRTDLQIDYDGAPNAYHPQGRKAGALDHTANAGKPGNWYGIVTEDGKSSGVPYVQQAGIDPRPGFYTSSTTLQDRTVSRATDPRRYVDASAIPYIVLPPKAMKAAKAKPGDFAAALNLKTGEIEYAIFADVGPGNLLGEASLYLVQRLSAGTRGKLDVAIVVFPGSRKEPAWPLALEDIRAEGARLLGEMGGVDELRRLIESE